MSFSDAVGQIDQIVQWEQQLADPAAATQTASSSATAGTSSAATTSSSSSASFADTLAAAQADTEASAASTLGDTTDTSTAGLTGSSLLGGGDSQLLSALSSMSTGSTASSTGTSSTDASSLATLDGLDALTGNTTDGSSDALLSALQSAQAGQTTVSSDSGPGGGQATSAADPRIQAMTEEANALVGKPYVWGGGHDGWGPSSGYDCSGFVSAVLHAGGYLTSPQDTTTLPSATGMDQGPGQYVTIYDRDQPGHDGHVIIEINGQFYEAGGEHGSWGGGGGVEAISTPTSAYLSTFNVILHPAGL